MRVYIAILLLGMVTKVTASVPDIDGTKELCHSSAKLFEKGKMKDLADILVPHWPINQEEINKLVHQGMSQFELFTFRSGSALGTEFIDTREVGSSFVMHTYAIKFEYHAMRYNCIFYKPKDEWVVNTINWDGKLELLFNQ
ncbi:hypothetical protein L4D09_25175 [Photobacterium makurazakiensis]|uniref:hypothetical protein n=1 Tax=Photobacterium makurazakiensis TaxID=2910234 RepID=UPI003D0E83C3